MRQTVTALLTGKMRELGHSPEVVLHNRHSHRVQARCARCGSASDVWYDVEGEALPRSMQGPGTTQPCQARA